MRDRIKLQNLIDYIKYVGVPEKPNNIHPSRWNAMLKQAYKVIHEPINKGK